MFEDDHVQASWRNSWADTGQLYDFNEAMIFTPPVAFGFLWQLRQGSGVHLTSRWSDTMLVQILLAQVSTGGLKKWETLRKTSTALASENWLFWTKLVRCRTRQRIRKHIPVFSRVELPPVGRVKGPDAPLRAGRWRDCFQSLMKGGCWRLSPVTLVIDMLSRRPLALFGVSRKDGP